MLSVLKINSPQCKIIDISANHAKNNNNNNNDPKKKLCILTSFFSFFLFYDKERHQGMGQWDHPWGLKPQMPTHPHWAASNKSWNASTRSWTRDFWFTFSLGTLPYRYWLPNTNLFFFFWIGNQKTIINEKKGRVQDVHDDEHQEKIEQTTQQKEKSGN